MNIASLLERSGNAFDSSPAVFSGTQQLLNYRQLARRSAIMATHLRLHFGLSAGDRVAIISANCPEYVELYFAIWHAGLVAVPVNAKLHIDDFEYVIAHSGAKVCFSSPKLVDLLSPLTTKITHFKQCISIGSEQYLALYHGECFALVDRAPNDPAWLFYTSGTTGKPKGAMQSHQNLLTMTQCYFSDVDTVDAGDCIFHAAPMSHGGGYYILPHIAHGGINVVPKSGGFDEQELLDLLSAHQQVSMFAAPTMVKRWVEYGQDQPEAFANLKTIIYGGGPMYQQDLANAQALLGNKLVQIYGQGECPMSITSLSKFDHSNAQHPDFNARLASIGTPMLGTEVKIIDSKGNDVEDDQPGEIIVRSAATMLGYFDNEQATQETFVNGWLRTGDMAIKSDDGYFTLVDRAKDVIISGGTNIYPREVEEVLNTHPQIAETSVIGKTDAQWGEIVIAVVVPVDPSEINAERLDAFCLEKMARFKRPKHYIFVEELPKNNTGKILKTELRKLYG